MGLLENTFSKIDNYHYCNKAKTHPFEWLSENPAII